MERIVQKLNSPLLKRKSLTDRNRNFGVPLKCLIYKKSILVPRIVENICEFILEYGLQTEGIFRVNGSTKAIASLKAQFDITSADDLNYSDCEDIHAICGVFKLFLREIPDGLIPDVSTKQIVKIMDQLKDEKPQCILKLRNVVINLPEENYNLLRYVCHFLRQLMVNEESTKMSAANLGIVFGPCLFKCGLGVQGLRQQNLSNLATTYFITHFDVVFSPSPPSQSSSISSQLHQHIQFGLLKSATSLNSLLQRRRRSGVVPRRSMVTATSTEEAMAVTSLSVSGHVGGGSRSRPISPRGDTASPLLSPHAIDSSCLVAHSASSLSLSPSRKWQYSDAEENDLGSHGALARELASIMTSISIPSVSKPVDSTPTSTSNRKPTLPKPSVSSSSSTEPIKESPEGLKNKPSPPLVVVEDLAKSMPSLVQPYLQPRRQNCHNHHHRHHNHDRATQNRRLWLGRCVREHRSRGGDGEKVSSDSSSSATSLLEIAAFSTSITTEKTIPQILTESNTETTTHTLTVDDEFEPCHAYLSSNIVDGVHLAQHPTFAFSDSEEPESEDNQSNNENKDLEKKEEPMEINTTPIYSSHHFPRAKYRYSQNPSSPNQGFNRRLRYGVVNCLEQRLDDATFSEINRSSPLQTNNYTEVAVVTVVSPSEDHHFNSALISDSGPRILIGNPVCQSVTPKPQHISTWPRKRNILNRLHNRRSLDVCIPLNDRKHTTEEVTVSTVDSEPRSSNLTLDNLTIPDLETGGFFSMLIAVLQSRREECQRPEDLEKMTSSELTQEKLDLQKCLLYFENAKGRPMDSVTKRIMKPLYDRYRCVRRMVRLSSNSAVRLTRGRSSGSAPRPSIDSVEAPPKTESTPPPPPSAQCSTEAVGFLSEQPVIILESSPLLVTSSTNFSHSETTERTNSIMSNPPSNSFFLNWDLTLLEFTKAAKTLEPKDLTRGRGEILSVKHKLQRFLYDFEKGIQESTNRPPSKQDRDGFRSVYNRYRDCKQRLYVIDQFLEKPQTIPESLIVDAQAVGRAHRRRHAFGESAAGDEMLQQKVSTVTKNSSADTAIA